MPGAQDRAPLDGPARIGPGRLVLVVGPSGAGKDTLIDAARRRLAGSDAVLFPSRVVTRPPSAAEANAEVDAATFATLARVGGFALSWSAHGHDYGIPIAIDHLLTEGRTVVCNVSRSILEAARRRYEAVIVVEITAPAAVLAARIAARGRSSDGDATARVARLVETVAPADLTILNDGPVEAAIQQFLAIVDGPAKPVRATR
ncbi:phosphonate metabolism protein/1,5-bisphosphokinase (PRPP-forming) PhnN [Phreatobacter stygius]|uniref:Ribose 1,5-bisphosphate phosphokinase PhnN n=1 Tax=Phreatobacter stygius TaxID=1940610 RepID=A0A4D7BH51_9HYPH|nr:phosphonate metabolism protein/1,5-bisphosphokinase (PRPP-forming) PhnN [Phreatobacter stygius]